MPPPPPTPELTDDAISEILLRLPPDDPACLVRASLVCKLWHGILSDVTFPDRYREFHRTPPLLGFLRGSYFSGHDESGDRFVPVVAAATRVPFCQHPAYGCRALDCRHGRVLLDVLDVKGIRIIRESLAVWDPVTGDHKVLSDPNPAAPDPYSHSGAVLCAAAGAGCDHRGCCCPFRVVFVSPSYNGDGTKFARAWVYSSETAAWSAAPPAASVQIKYSAGYTLVERKRAAIVGDQIYFLLKPGLGILRYDLGRRCLTVIDSPCTYRLTQPGILMAMDDGSLGFAGVKDDSSTIHLWRATTKANPDGSSMGLGWVQDRVILLNNLLVPSVRSTQDTYSQVINVVGFAEGVDILLLGMGCRGFVFELKSGRFRKVSKTEYYHNDVFLPYLSFYIPDFTSHK